ncbi:MAG: hypothetical protein FJW86_11605 [Actinobacteria bacterium]|nr:hypothetical protein [Actinomycetota bacterium]
MPKALRVLELFATLHEHRVRYIVIGGIAAALHGSPLMTVDVDICPDTHPANLQRLCDALRAMNARIRTASEDDGVDFQCHPELLAGMRMLNLVTDFGELDLTFEPPAFENGYSDLAPQAVAIPVGSVEVRIAALDNVIESKEQANRPKDRAALPVLYALRDEIAERDR